MHLLDKYLIAYSTTIGGRKRRRTRSEVELETADLARAYSRLTSHYGQLNTLFKQLRITRLLDVGCGTGGLLANLALANPKFRALGIDANRFMARAARLRISELNLARRVKIVNVNASEFLHGISREQCETFDAIHCGSVINSFFGNGNASATSFLRLLARKFKGKFLIVEDYYGQLGRRSYHSLKPSLGLAHDLFQALSGQGVPPSDIRVWKKLYRTADGNLIFAFEGEQDGFRWFIHIIAF